MTAVNIGRVRLLLKEKMLHLWCFHLSHLPLRRQAVADATEAFKQLRLCHNVKCAAALGV